MRAARRLLALIMALGILIAWQAPAYAVDGYQETYAETPSGQQADQGCDQDRGEQIRRDMGIACFFRYGDDFWINDRAADGHSVGIQWRLTDGSRHGLIRDKLGQGVDSMLRKEYAQGDVLMWRMGRCNETSTNNCRQGADYSGWGILDGSRPAREAMCTPVGDTGAAYFCTWPS